MQGVELSATPAALAVAVLREGCIGETLAAALARAQLEVVGDAACRASLEMIARDEAEHSLLAWRTVKHTLEVGGAEVAARLRDAISEARPTLGSASSTPTEWIWNHYGRLTPEQEQVVVEQTWRDVIEPALELLLGPATRVTATSSSGMASTA
jgi:hypothetical protein